MTTIASWFLRATSPPTRTKPMRATLLAAFVLAWLIVPPLVLTDYRLLQFAMVAIYAMALLGLVVLTGYGGQISLGHGAFYAVGAYAAAILMNRLSVPYWVVPLPVGAICLVVGYLFGLPALRLPGHHLALATFGLAITVPQLLRYKNFEPLLGGPQGLTVTRADPPWGLPLSSDQWIYLLAVVLLGALYWLARNLLRGRMGRAIVAVRDHSTAAAAMGVDTAFVKSMTFAISSMFTGVAGAASAVVVMYVSPDSFSPMLSITLLVGAVIGGLTSLPGALLGAAFIQFLPNFTEQISQSASTAVYGVLVIVAMYFMPFGLAGAFKSLAIRCGLRRELK